MDAEDVDRIVRVVAARCEGALTPVEIDAIEAALASKPSPVMLSGEIAERIGDLLSALEARLDGMLATVAERERENAFVDAAAAEVVWN